MSSFNWNNHLHEEYGEPDGTENSAQVEISVPEGKTAIILGNETFFVELPEKFTAVDVQLLIDGPDPEDSNESYRLTELLRCLKQRKNIQGVGVNGCETEGPEVRRQFIAALKEREGILAQLLRQKLQR
jgi:hypothetical protein